MGLQARFSVKNIAGCEESASSVVSLTRPLQAESPPNRFVLDDTRVDETTASLPLARPALKQSWPNIRRCHPHTALRHHQFLPNLLH
jgi:hypothetical protein